jgi:Heterokaryon incompatibility protein (HET)
LALSLGYGLVWIDTCCINKGSTTELAEAINSMYRWYAKASICIAYLEDVGEGRRPLKDSEWFERGWTLQELIAPRSVRFFDYEWRLLGDKIEILDLLATITRVPVGVLSGATSPRTCSIAQRMSWAAGRRTTRVEDRAYSLLGLFGVSIPMIYGEQESAFIRLQEEIIKKSADESIFCWNLEPSTTCAGLLAPSPDAFETCGGLADRKGSRGFSMDNLGFRVELQTALYGMSMYLALLSVSELSLQCGIFLARYTRNGQYVRVKDLEGKSMIKRFEEHTDRNHFRWQVLRAPQEPTEKPLSKIFPRFRLQTLRIGGSTVTNPVTYSKEGNLENHIILPNGVHDGLAGIVVTPPVKDQTKALAKIYVIGFWFDIAFDPHYSFTTVTGMKSVRFSNNAANWNQVDPEDWERLPDHFKEMGERKQYAHRSKSKELDLG